MRELISKRLIEAFERHTPAPVIRLELRILTGAVARAFGTEAVRLPGGSLERALARFAQFSKECMEKPGADPERIFKEGYCVGEKVRKLTGLKNEKDLARLVFLLYRNIGIVMGGDLPGFIEVSECRFSALYGPAQCVLMSNMDSGVISGIMDGGRLCFSARITEGAAACSACFKKEV